MSRAISKKLTTKTGANRARTPLGRRLAAIRKQIVASGVPLLNWNQIRREVKRETARRSQARRAEGIEP